MFHHYQSQETSNLESYPTQFPDAIGVLTISFEYQILQDIFPHQIS